jgi:hypothetical protein
MNEILSLTQINSMFPDEWVLVDDPEFDNGSSLLIRGRVACHSRVKKEVFDTAATLKLPRVAFHYTGEFSADKIYVL